MQNLTVTTASGGAYRILDATAFGPDAVIGRTESDPTPRVFRFEDTDVVKADA